METRRSRPRRSSLVVRALVTAVMFATIAAASDVPGEWRTPAEAAGYRSTPSYDDTLAFLRRVGERLPELRLESFGTTASGRPMTVAVVSKERFADAAAARASGKPIVLVVNGIHAGEIDGKDASLELLRDFALGRRRELLDAATLLIVPVYNVDGHERVSPWNRPNQDGPVEGMGFRTTADGHDLNRDWMKLETAEARAMLSLVREWDPHLVVDDHVTNGSDHDWTFTWAAPEAPQLAAPLARWLASALPGALRAVEAAGYRTGPYPELEDELDPERGIVTPAYGARYSTGYFALRRRATVLVETHSHKPFAERVAANREFLAGLIAEVGRRGRELVAASRAADAERPREVVLDWKTSAAADPIRFPVYAWSRVPSTVTGGELLRYQRGEVREIEVPWRHRPEASATLPRPRALYVLPGWPAIERRLEDHGVRFDRLAAARGEEVETVRITHPRLAARSFQGLVGRQGELVRAVERRDLPVGTLVIPSDQPLFELAVALLDPGSSESLWAWGLLGTVEEGKEWIGPPELEDQAARLLEDDAIRAEWEKALTDPAFAADPAARYRWWYRRTPYWDETVGLVPVFRAPDGRQASRIRKTGPGASAIRR
ncbi:MAG: hypothetical protein AMXMBFR36_37050 [Acidobacteriota bacterium]